MYSLLTPIRYVLNPRFRLSTSMQSGLFYIAPGCGYLVGMFLGGRADHVVKKWIYIRGQRFLEDILSSSLVFMGLIIPGCMLALRRRNEVYHSQSLRCLYRVLLNCFAFHLLILIACLDVMQTRSAESVGVKYMLRYFFAAIGTAMVLPAIEKKGWFSVISAFLVIVTQLMWATAV